MCAAGLELNVAPPPSIDMTVSLTLRYRHVRYRIFLRPDPIPAVAPARRGGVSAHGHSAVRRPPEVDQGAGNRDGSGQEHPAGGAEIRRQGRARGRGPVPDRQHRQHSADAEAARRHRQGAGRRQRSARCISDIDDQRTPFVADSAAGPGGCQRQPRGRGDAPRADDPVRPVREAEQEDSAGDPDFARRHRRGRASGRHHRRAPAAQARAEAGSAGDVRRQGAPRTSAGAAGSRDSTSCRWKSASAAASSARWRRASASIT